MVTEVLFERVGLHFQQSLRAERVEPVEEVAALAGEAAAGVFEVGDPLLQHGSLASGAAAAANHRLRLVAALYLPGCRHNQRNACNNGPLPLYRHPETEERDNRHRSHRQRPPLEATAFGAASLPHWPLRSARLAIRRSSRVTAQHLFQRRHRAGFEVAGRRERLGERPDRLDLAERGEQRRRLRIVEITRLKENVLARAEGRPEVGPLDERAERGVDDEAGEVIERRVEVGLGAVGVLVVAVADLRAGLACERRDEHRVVIDEHEPHVAVVFADEDVAVLEVAVRDPGVFQIDEQRAPGSGEGAQDIRITPMLFDERRKPLPFRPRHLQDGIARPADPDAFRLVVERDGTLQLCVGEVLRDGPVSSGLILHARQKAAHSKPSTLGLDRKDSSERTRDGLRQAEGVRRGRPRREVRVGERRRGKLQRLLVVAGSRVVGHRTRRAATAALRVPRASRRRCAARSRGRTR